MNGTPAFDAALYPSGYNAPRLGVVVWSAALKGGGESARPTQGFSIGRHSMVTLRVNGKSHALDIEGEMPLLWALRDEIGLTGTKFGCGIAQCGACTVHVDGVAMRSCSVPVASVHRHAVD